MSELIITSMDAVASAEVITWRYPPPYDIYNLTEDPVMLTAIFSDPQYCYFQMHEAGVLVGFCCFGAEGRMRGGDYSDPALDVGIAMRPDLTGQGLGRRSMGAVLAFGSAQFGSPTFRLTVDAFNARARRLYINLGFRNIQRFTSPTSRRDYIVMIRPPPQLAEG